MKLDVSLFGDSDIGWAVKLAGSEPEYYLSDSEYDTIQIKERIPAIEVARRLRLDPNKNARDHIDLELTPYHKLPLKMMGKSIVWFIYAIAPTQSGKTLLAQVFLADRILQSPGTILYTLPTEKSGNIQFKEKVISLIRETPELLAHVPKSYTRNLSQSGIHFHHMDIYPAWSNSASTMNSSTCPGGVMDEIRLMPIKLRDGTNAVEYMWDRAKTYGKTGKAQFVGVTTPSHEGDLMHLQLGKPLTQELWFMSECGGCGKMQVLDIYENFVYDELSRDYDPACLCKYCDWQFNDRQEKKPMNERGFYGRWEEQGKLRKDIDLIIPTKIMIFRWTSEVSPFTSFVDIAEKYSIVKDDFAALINFNTCWRARFEKQNESLVTKEMLAHRIDNEQPRAEVPSWCKVLTAGVDSQGDSFYWSVLASGADKRSAIIEYGRLESHHLSDSNDTVHRLFKQYFEEKIYFSKTGKKWAIGLWAIDTGGNRTSQVYSAIEGLDKCVPCKGAGMRQEENIKTAKNAQINGLFMVNTYNYLVLTDSICLSDNFNLPARTGSAFLTQYCNLRIVKDLKPDKFGNDVKYPKSFGKFDYRISHMHCEIAKDIKMSYGTSFRDDLQLPDFEYNPIDMIILGEQPDKKKRNYAGKITPSEKYEEQRDYGNYKDPDDYDVGDFTNNGSMM